jgi:hypothetical protein
VDSGLGKAKRGGHPEDAAADDSDRGRHSRALDALRAASMFVAGPVRPGPCG